MEYSEYREAWDRASEGGLTIAPLHIDLELNSTCNLRCGFCYYSSGFNDHGYMSKELAESIIKQAGMLGVPAMKYQYRGEPAMRKDLPEFIKLSKDCGIMETMINTNGNCSFARLKGCIDAGIDKLIFSIDAHSKETYSQIRIRGDYDIVRNNVESCLKYISEENSKTKVKVQFVQTPVNQHETDDFVSYWKDLGAEVRTSICMPRGGKDNSLTIGCSGDRQYCGFPNQRLTILYDGTVLPCCAMIDREYVVGDANTESLFSIWNGDKMNKIRSELLSKNYSFLDKCLNCSCAGSYK